MHTSGSGIRSQSESYTSSYTRTHRSESTRSTKSRILGRKVTVLNPFWYQHFYQFLNTCQRKKLVFKKLMSTTTSRSGTLKASEENTSKTLKENTSRESSFSCGSKFSRTRAINKQKLSRSGSQNIALLNSISNNIHEQCRIRKELVQSFPSSTLPKLLKFSNIQLQMSTEQVLTDSRTIDQNISLTEEKKLASESRIRCVRKPGYVHENNKELNTRTTKLLTSTSTFDVTLGSNDYSRTWLSQKNQYARNYFYAMNLQFNHKRHKLEPYECEPGVCIPGQCDPYECEKLIRRRLMKKSSTMTSTGSRRTAVSCETDRAHSNSKSQNHTVKQRAVPVIQYQTLPRKQKQAVRVGSTFSFNIDFIKDRRSGDTDSESCKKKPCSASTGTSWEGKHMKAQGTRGHSIGSQDGGSQSGAEMKHKGSMITSRFQRCFCTLQLHKRGKQQKGINIQTRKVPNQNAIIFKTTGQNTKKIRDPNLHSKNIKKYDIRDLDPQECEPNICIPGECNPYECLKRIQARNKALYNKGVGSGKQLRSASASSMTSYTRNKGVQNKHKRIHAQKIRPVKRVESSVRPVTHSALNSGHRSAIRIGSSFSFNVEFYKDKSLGDGLDSTTCSTDKPLTKKEKTQGPCQKLKMCEKPQECRTDCRNKKNQSSALTRHGSTGTGSLLKRCFCTAKLHSKKRNAYNTKKVIKSRQDTHSETSDALTENSTPLKYKCAKTCTYCKLLNNKGKLLNGVKYAENVSQTNKIHRLKPYECEPGFCVPGQCDPYVCAERIKKRSHNVTVNTISSTNRSISKSINTRPKYSKTSYSQSQRKKRKVQRTKIQSPIPFSECETQNRSAVRIGSNFSFSVEFYKDKKSDCNNAVCREPVKLKTMKVKDQNTSVRLHSSLSQVDVVKKLQKGTGIRPMLKRCFCTLALQKNTNKGKQLRTPLVRCINTVSHGTDCPVCKVIPNFKDGFHDAKPYKLKPYECEPGVCIPGECDPYECDKLIKKRLCKDAATKMVCNTCDRDAQCQRKKFQHRNVQLFQKKEKKQYIPPPPPPPVSPIKQSVRFGSNFSFNVEFFKETNQNNGECQQPFKKSVRKLATPCQKTACKDMSCGGAGRGVSRKSQFDRHGMDSKASGAGLKRCFCTLKLLNGHKKQQINCKPVKTMQNTYTGTKPTKQTLYKTAGTKTNKVYPDIYPLLEPNECEPGTCVPGRCNPIECLKRIRERLRKPETDWDDSMYECEPGVCVPGECDPYECFERMKRKRNYQLPAAKSQKCSNTQCITKDCDAQTCQVTECKGSATPPLKRCFCTAKLFQQQALQNKRNPAFTVGRVDMFKTMTPFTPSNKYCYYLKDMDSTSEVNVSESIAENIRILKNFILDTKTEKPQYIRKEMKTILPYVPTDLKENESNSLSLPPFEQEKVMKTSVITIIENNFPKMPEKVKLTRKFADKSPNRTALQIFSKQSQQATFGSNKMQKMTEKLHKDYLKKSKSERKPEKISCEPMKSKSMKIFKTDSSIPSTLLKKMATIEYSPLQSGDTCWNKNSFPHCTVRNNRHNNHVLKMDAMRYKASNKKIVKNIFKFVRFIFKKRTATDLSDIQRNGKEIKRNTSPNKLKNNIVIDPYISCKVKRAAGDTTRYNDTASLLDKINPNTKYQVETCNVVYNKKKAVQKKDLIGIKLTLKGKHPKAQIATFFNKPGNTKNR